MTAMTLFLTVALAHLLAVMSPGPDFAVVVRQTLAHSRSAGLWTALGIASGLAFHIGWAMFGLGWVIERYPPLLDILRYAGSAFLLWIGIGALRARPGAVDVAASASSADGKALHHYGIGLATNLLNPKAMLFFVALCSAVITGETPVWLRAELGAWMIASTAAWFSLVSLTLGHPRVRNALLGRAHWIDRAMGAILILLALTMLVRGTY